MAPERVAEAPDGPSATFLAEQAARPRRVGVRRRSPSADPALPRPGEPARAWPARTASATTTTRSTRSPTAASTSTTPPATSFLTVEIEGLRCSFFVCYDLRFADEFWALADRHRLLRGGGQLAGGPPPPLAVAARWPGPSRTRPTWWACNRVGRGRRPAATPATADDRRPAAARCWRSAAGRRDGAAGRRRPGRGRPTSGPGSRSSPIAAAR